MVGSDWTTVSGAVSLRSQSQAVYAPENLGLHEEPHRQRRAIGGIAASVGVLDARHRVDHARARIELAFGAHDVSTPDVRAPGELRAQDHLGCRRLTALDFEAAHGRLAPPTWRDPISWRDWW